MLTHPCRAKQQLSFGLCHESGDVGAKPADEGPITLGDPSHRDVEPIGGVAVSELREQPLPLAAPQQWGLSPLSKQGVHFAKVDGLNTHVLQHGTILRLPGLEQFPSVRSGALAHEGSGCPRVG
ncbi:hypothetical protein StoSoilB13_20400 [Arthrobacter sp. StoSoilB13]|nr:hypothetical protein StoSoilB13_20400 [Arthrobacter sp. StoSoilB13]